MKEGRVMENSLVGTGGYTEHNRESCAVTDLSAWQLSWKSRMGERFISGWPKLIFSFSCQKEKKKSKILKNMRNSVRNRSLELRSKLWLLSRAAMLSAFGFLPNGHKKEFIWKTVANTNHILNFWSAIKFWLLKNWQLIHALYQQAWCY